MGYSPRYHTYTSEFPGQHGETDDWSCVESTIKRAKDQDIAGFVIDTHTNQAIEFRRIDIPPIFPTGMAVRVDHPRFHGYGIARYDSSSRTRVVSVLIESGNTWDYEAETVRPAREAERSHFPRHMKDATCLDTKAEAR